jgi:carbamate kinase
MRIVIAIGGNAIIREGERGTWDEMRANARVVAEQLAEIKRRGHELVLTHGNGPQVGALHLQHAVAAEEAPPLPLDVLVAMTQGELGYLLQGALEEVDPRLRTVTVLTRVRVADDDPAFAQPTKPIGRFYDEAEAADVADRRGWTMAPDAGRGWRCVIPSPRPLGILEFDSIRRLVMTGALVIASGGGGIPVIESGGRREGVEAVIDKDRASAELARAVDADRLVLLTGVECVALDYGTRWQRDMAQLRVTDARALLDRGEFPPGSMGPKIESATRFADHERRVAIVTSAERLVAALDGEAGTRIVADTIGPSLHAGTRGVVAAA